MLFGLFIFDIGAVGIIAGILVTLSLGDGPLARIVGIFAGILSAIGYGFLMSWVVDSYSDILIAIVYFGPILLGALIWIINYVLEGKNTKS